MGKSNSEGAPQREQQPTEKRKALIRAAIKIFAEKGYHNTRVSDIVQEVGAAQGVFYYYFENKEDILLDIYHLAWNNLYKRLEVIHKEDIPPINKLREVMDYFYDSYQQNPDLMKVLIMDVVHTSDSFYNEENQKLWYKVFEKLAAIIKEGQDSNLINQDISPSVAAFIFHGAVDWLIRHDLYGPNTLSNIVPIKDSFDQLIRIFLNGIVDVRAV